ncbi:MAG: MmgE/PrpD family protein [Chloroflexota bacterium]
MDQGNHIVASFIADVSWDQLPGDVQHVAQLALLDTLGAALVGTLTPVSRITARFAAETWPGRQAAILLHGLRASPAGAAFANAYAANAIDIDDCGIYTKGHPGVQIVPTALALAEAHGLSGAETLTAIVVGYEVAHRAGRIWHATRDVYQACGSWGSLACAAVAARLTGLDERQIPHALGIADYHAPNLPMMRDIDHPTMVKHGIGWGAMTGILSARLAAGGFTAVPSLLALEEHADWVADIGDHYVVADGLAWKRYACCAWDHAAILGAAQLMREHHFGAQDIARVRVESFHETVRLGTDLPTTTEEAQFNLAWPLAASIVDGEVGPDQILEHALHRQDIRDLAERIEVVETPELNELYRLACQGDPRGKYASRVVIELHDGRTLRTAQIEGEINFPQETWDDESLEKKFRWLTGHVLEESDIDALTHMLSGFAELPDVRQLTAALA